MAEVRRRVRIGAQFEQEVTRALASSLVHSSHLPGHIPPLGELSSRPPPCCPLLIQVKHMFCVRGYPESSYASGGAPRDRLLGSS